MAPRWTSTLLPGAWLFGLLLPGLLLLAGCAADRDAAYLRIDSAVQRPHLQILPHLDEAGRLRHSFDPQLSFLPLALGGALVDYRRGVSRGFADAFAADFNAVVGDPDQPLPALLRAAEGSGVRLLRPRHEDDSDRGLTVLLDASAAAVIAMPRDPVRIDDFAAAAQAAIKDGRPVWALLPAHGTAEQRLLQPNEARALAYAALVHGASGLIWQGEDNYAARNAGAIGIAAAPQIDYGIGMRGETDHVAIMAPPYRASPAEVAASKRLWDTVAGLNRAIARLRPALLQPDIDQPYMIALASSESAMPAPVRSLLKPWEDGWLMIAVNLDAYDHAIRVDFDRPLRRIARFTGPDAALSLEQDSARGRFYDTFEPYGVRLYRITP